MMSVEFWSLMFAMAATIIGAAYTLWNRLSSKIDKVEANAAIQVAALKKDFDTLEKTVVLKEDHNESMRNMTRLVEGINLALREMGATMTQRIDMVLFEVGRQNNGNKPS